MIERDYETMISATRADSIDGKPANTETVPQSRRYAKSRGCIVIPKGYQCHPQNVTELVQNLKWRRFGQTASATALTDSVEITILIDPVAKNLPDLMTNPKEFIFEGKQRLFQTFRTDR